MGKWMMVVVAGAALAGCGLPADDGVVMSCFGVINQTVPGNDVLSDQVVTNLYFGGCSPSDPGMQILERSTVNADPAAVAAACDVDCDARLAAYVAVHPEVKLPLSCQTIFASTCDGLGADVSQLPANATTAFQAGGPADERIALSGTVNIDGMAAAVPASGIIDATVGPCTGGGQSCPVTLSRFDITASQGFVLNGMTIDSAQVQNQGRAVGQISGGQFVIPVGAIEAEVSFSAAGSAMSFHVKNDQPVSRSGALPDPGQLFASLNLTMGGGMVQIAMQGTVAGHRPVADLTPRSSTVQCTSPDATPVSFFSAATDVDQDLQSLTWLLDNAVQVADGTNAPPELDLSAATGEHTRCLWWPPTPAARRRRRRPRSRWSTRRLR